MGVDLPALGQSPTPRFRTRHLWDDATVERKLIMIAIIQTSTSGKCLGWGRNTKVSKTSGVRELSAPFTDKGRSSLAAVFPLVAAILVYLQAYTLQL